VERDVKEVKAECLMHMKGQADIEADIPSSIDIGLFRLSCDRVRRTLADKRKALATGVLNLLGRGLRKQADLVCASFAEISHRLCVPGFFP
jgi:dynein heavy chain